MVFSFSSGIIHTYYLSALAPATAALIGAGVVALWRDARAGGLRIGLPLAALALSGWLEVALLRRSGYDSWLQAIVVIGTAAAVVVLVGARRGSHAWGRSPPGGDGRGGPRGRGAVRGAGGLVVDRLQERRQRRLPRRRAELPVGRLGGRRRRPAAARSGGGGNFGGPPPGTRPQRRQLHSSWRRTAAPPGRGGIRTGGGAGFGGGAASSASITAALKYVEAHGATKRFGLIVQNEQEAATAVIAGEPVASLGGFTGRETVLTNSYLARLISRGEARYFLLGGQSGVGGPGGTSNAAVSTITSICKAVSITSSGASSGGSATLYDCAGKAEAIASAG